MAVGWLIGGLGFCFCLGWVFCFGISLWDYDSPRIDNPKASPPGHKDYRVGPPYPPHLCLPGPHKTSFVQFFGVSTRNVIIGPYYPLGILKSSHSCFQQWVEPFYIPISKIRQHPFLHSLTSTYFLFLSLTREPIVQSTSLILDLICVFLVFFGDIEYFSCFLTFYVLEKIPTKVIFKQV